jgi:hypothetical protein
MSIWFENLTGSRAYIFAGDSRYNSTRLVQNDDSVAVGAPIVIPVSTGAVIVSLPDSTGTSGQLQFSY